MSEKHDCTRHPEARTIPPQYYGRPYCEGCWFEDLDHEMECDLKSCVYSGSDVFSFEERCEMARKQGWPLPTK